jgi:hypothetical protein
MRSFVGWSTRGGPWFGVASSGQRAPSGCGPAIGCAVGLIAFVVLALAIVGWVQAYG